MNFFRAIRSRSRVIAALVTVSFSWLAFAGSAFALSTIGEQKTAVILVNFQDDASQPITPAAAYSQVFGTVSDMYWEASYQKTFFSGNVFGWFTIPVSKTTCDTALIAAEADRAANAAGANLAGYSRLVYLFPENACTISGYNSGPTTVPSRTWMKGNIFTPRAIAHEIGHNFGMSHSQASDCGATVLGSSCTVQSYGDPADTMGNGTMPQFNAIQKELLGWLGAGTQPPITVASASGRYSINRFETTGTTAKALKVPKGIDPLTGQMSYYYVEYRQPLGFDAVLGSVGNLTSGVMVHAGGYDQFSELLDMTPNSNSTSSLADFNDAALTVGRSFTDSASGVTLTLVSADGNNAVVDVSIGSSQTPPPPPPSGTLSESVGTDKASYLRGQTVYMSSRTLNNGTPVAGAQVTFTIGLPAGGSTILSATSDSSGYARTTYKLGKGKAAIGGYAVRATASSGAASGSADGSFAVN